MLCMLLHFLTYGILTMSLRYMCTVCFCFFLSQAATWSLIVFLSYFLYVIKHVDDISQWSLFITIFYLDHLCVSLKETQVCQLLSRSKLCYTAW